jgi:UDP-N-acetylmuramoyl-L-alanyl-D-glutamate--2,6-diaminopimelate ligase
VKAQPLSALLARVGGLFPIDVSSLPPSALDAPVTGITYDSRAVTPGNVFVALQGAQTDGAAYATDAMSRGAIAVVGQDVPAGVAGIRVQDGRAALAALAAIFYGHPSERLIVVGVTGTNGKTTTTYLLTSIFESAGLPCGRIGTVGYRVGHEERPAARTTPEAPDLQRMLREMVDEGAAACAIEVSSHALELKRVDFVRFAAAVFTNLTRDHLDFHGDMESYFAAKRKLFERLPADAPAAINVDDPRGARLAEAVGTPITYGITQAADVRPVELSLTLTGIEGVVQSPAGTFRLRMSMPGRPNAYNALGAAAVAIGLHLPLKDIEAGLMHVPTVPGRFEVVSSAADDVSVIVDYAHTDDALKNLLETARALTRQRIITVFGCGGDRDRTKRPLMGAVAARLSDLVVLTSDNPRSEDPLAIIEEIKRGFVPPDDRPARKGGVALAPIQMTPWLAIPDREEAITRAVADAEPGDVVIVAGKGHETTQVIGSRVLPFDDASVSRQALLRRRQASSVSG